MPHLLLPEYLSKSYCNREFNFRTQVQVERRLHHLKQGLLSQSAWVPARAKVSIFKPHSADTSREALKLLRASYNVSSQCFTITGDVSSNLAESTDRAE